MSENWQSEPGKTTHRLRGFFIYVALLVLAFLLGLVPMWLASRECSSRLADAERQSSLVRMENTLAAATIAAQRGDYETARQAASDFFTVLRTETSNGVDSALSEAEMAGLQPLLTRRDEIITLLARGEGTSADLLSDLYVSYRELVNQ
jgi:hypothetical protein